MSDEQNQQQTGTTGSTGSTGGTGQTGSGEAWREVGKQFETMGATLAEAVRTAWYSEENRKRLMEMQSGLESMVKVVSQAIKESASSPQAQQAKTQARTTAGHLRDAGEQTIQELRPHLVSALHQVNEELRKLVARLESEKAASANKTNEPPTGTPDK